MLIIVLIFDILQLGEVLVYNPRRFKRFAFNPEATADIMSADGWVHTGDLGMIDDEGNLVLQGRLKGTFITPLGHNVFLQQIEDVIQTHPLVKEWRMHCCSCYGK